MSDGRKPEGAEEAPRAARRVTLKDIAEAAGVHVATASRAMSGSPLIPEATRAQIQGIARKMGYERDPMLQALVSYRKATAASHYHGTVAWLLTDQHRDAEFYESQREGFRAAEAAAKPLGYLLEEFRVGDAPPEKILRQLAARGITGIIFPPLLQPGVKLDIDLGGFAAVKIGQTLESPQLNMVLPNQYGNTLLFLDKLREAGWRRIGFYLPKVVDSRTSGAFSAAYWRWQQNIPERERLEVGLPDGFDEAHFAAWFRRVRPKFVVGLPAPSLDWMRRARLKPVPVAFPATLAEASADATRIDERWDMIYAAAVRTLDSMLRHSERGVPESPRRVSITGRWVPGRWGSGPR